MRFLNQGRQLLKIAPKEKLLPFLGCLTGRLASTWNYEQEKKNFRLQAPPYYNFARDVIDKWAEKERTGERGDNPAFWWVDDSGNELKWSYRDVSYQSKLVANVLKEACKLEINDVVIVILPRIPHWWAINVGAIRAGIILSPGTTLLRSSDIKYRINASHAKCVITNAECAEHVDEVAELCPSLQSKIIVGEGQTRTGWLNYEELVWKSTDNFQCVNSKSDDPMTVFFTSGTTGAPKMTEHSHSSYGLGHLITARYFLDLSKDDVLWNLSDTGWAKCAWSSLFSPWIAGACVFVQDSPKFDPKQALQSLLSKPISKFCAPPTAVRFLQVEPNFTKIRNQKNLTQCVSGGEPVVRM